MDPGGNSVDINGKTSGDYDYDDDDEDEDEDEDEGDSRYYAEEKYEKILKDNKIETLSASFDL